MSSQAFELRPWTQADLDSLLRYADNKKIARNLTNFFPHPYRRKDGERFIQMVAEKKPTQVFAISVNGEAAGAIGIHPRPADDIECRNAELGYWLAEPYWGRGIMTRAVVQMVDYGFQTFDGIDRIFARPFGTNIGSQRVLEKAGFVLEGRFEKTLFKFGEYEDELIYAVRRGAWMEG